MQVLLELLQYLMKDMRNMRKAVFLTCHVYMVLSQTKFLPFILALITCN